MLVPESCAGGFIFDGACIELLYSRGTGEAYRNAVRLCAARNATLVEIASDRMFDVILNYVNSTWGAYANGIHVEWVNVWLGMTYDVIISFVALATGFEYYEQL